jgi:hypothetical protein
MTGEKDMKKARSVRVLVAAMSIAAGAFAFAQSSSQHGGVAHGGQAPSSQSQGANVDMMAGMQKMQEMKPSADTDKDFAMMMRMHDQWLAKNR